MVYQISTTGRCYRAYIALFTRSDKPMTCILSAKLAEYIHYVLINTARTEQYSFFSGD